MSGTAWCRAADGGVRQLPIGAALTQDAPFLWVHLATNTAKAQAWLRDDAKLSPFTVDALTAAETRPRAEKIGQGAFVNMRGRTEEELDSTDMLASIRIWATKGRVITVSRKRLVALDTVVEQMTAGELRDPGDLIAAFAAAITTDLDPVVADLGDRLDDCEQGLRADRVFELRRIVTRVRAEAITYRRFLSPQRVALERLAALPGDWLAEDDRAHLAAAADSAARMAEEVEAIRERAALMHEALTDLRAEQLDQRSLVIAMVAMVFLPLTFLTGLYGMNVKGLPYAEAPWAFDAIAGACALIAAGIVIWFARRHWFRG
ncbi:CorA family divalent cation transporter [Sphingomonas endophytica]|uniref:Magnesium transporter CorA n=1 Tax=Sphingomonas endophytica TaxID=869719 RepID=A0A147I8G9_9SPHN|nr:CorA family divalent cation transporter [Sphingomonas endophytica]KTT75511.1 magnesium transporter CorA [Sphingomonas endophytica]